MIIRVAAIVVAVIGLGIATYLTIVHYAGDAPVCAIAHGCATVQKSDYAKLAGVPVALLGMIGYLGILVSLAKRQRDVADRDGVPEHRRPRLQRLADLRRGRRAQRDLHLVRRLGDLHDAARRRCRSRGC